MTTTNMTPTRGPSSASLYPCGLPRTSSARSVIVPPRMTVRSPTGFGGRSNTNSLAASADHRRTAIAIGHGAAVVFDWPDGRLLLGHDGFEGQPVKR